EPVLDFVARARKLTKKELYPGGAAFIEASCHFMQDRLQESRRIMREIHEKSKDISLLSQTKQLWAKVEKRAAVLVAQYQKELPALLAQADAASARKMLDALRAADPRTTITPEFAQFEKQILQLEKETKPRDAEPSPQKANTETRAALGPNLLRNPSFEQLDPLTKKLAHWNTHQGVALNRVTSGAVSGRYFVELQREDRSAGSMTISSNTFTIPPGGKIVMEQYCRAIGAPKALLLHLYLEAGGKRTHYLNTKVHQWWRRSEIVLDMSPKWKEARVHLVFPAVPAGVKINVDEVAVMVYR
ncbi:MAG: hypothetical protein QF886_25360, partial [Planctomycetota bacterium]|nr:hypothetical protein [Planctomycetota bacterium]